MTDIRAHPPPATVPAAPVARPMEATGPGRVEELDGIRGLAALYVVLYHIFLRAWPGYPGANHAPFWAVWLSYGRGAVAIFIVLSGFSLGLGPARSGWRLKSIATYAHRRAWRILPPYWAALGFSLVMTWYVLAQPGWALPNGKSVVVYGLLVQDVFAAGSPNRAFWSIAIEAQLYVLLPFLLLSGLLGRHQCAFDVAERREHGLVVGGQQLGIARLAEGHLATERTAVKDRLSQTRADRVHPVARIHERRKRLALVAAARGQLNVGK